MLYVHCSICQESFRDGSYMSALLCGHVFHYECIQSWFNNKSNCPHCRSPNTGTFIKKLYFDKIRDANNSCANLNDSETENRQELRLEYNKLVEVNNKLTEERNKLSTDLDFQNQSCKKLQKELNKTVNLQRLKCICDQLSIKQFPFRFEYLSFSDQIAALDEQIKEYEVKFSKLKLVNDVLNSKRLQLHYIFF